MILPEYYDVIILGAGIAGLSAADAVLQKGKRCLIIDKHPANGASGSPMMLVNPATGRRAKKAWKTEEAYSHIHDLIQRVQQESHYRFFDVNGILRPALTPKIAADFRRSIEKYGWTNDWVEWIEREEFKYRYPFLSKNHGGLLVKKGITVFGKYFLESLSAYLEKRGLHTDYGSYAGYEKIKNEWYVDIGGGPMYTSPCIIDATGYHQTKSDTWNFLPLHAVKGQTISFVFDNPLPYNHSVSGLGYMAFLPQRPVMLTVGSTYEHSFKNLKPTDEALHYLEKKLESTIPGVASKSRYKRPWASARVSVKDKMPVIGQHPQQEGLYIIGALGSKGLLLGRYIAQLLVNSVFEKENIPSKVSISRFSETQD